MRGVRRIFALLPGLDLGLGLLASDLGLGLVIPCDIFASRLPAQDVGQHMVWMRRDHRKDLAAGVAWRCPLQQRLAEDVHQDGGSQQMPVLLPELRVRRLERRQRLRSQPR